MRALGRPQGGVVAERRGRQELLYGAELGRRRLPALDQNVSLRFVPHSEEVDRGLWRPHVLDDHAAFGEGAGLVGGEDRDGAERLHGGEPADESVPGRHAPGSQCEGQGHDGRQGFRDRCDGQADRRHRHDSERQALHQPEREDQQAQGQGHDSQDAPQRGETVLQGCRLPLGVEERGDPAERAVRAGGPHRRHTPASHDHGPRAHPRIALLVHGDGFPGEHGFVDHQGGRLGDIGVGRHDVALGEKQDIAGHHEGGGDLARSAVPQDPCLRCRHRGESGHGVVGTGLLHDAHGRVDDDHHGDDHRVGVVADRDRQYHRAQQHHDQRIA